MARRVRSVTGLAHDAKWSAGCDDLPCDNINGSKVSKVVTHAVVTNQRDEVSASVRRIISAARPVVDCADLRNRSAGWGDDECFAAEDINGWIIVVIGPVTHIAHREGKDIGRDWDRGRCTGR